MLVSHADFVTMHGKICATILWKKIAPAALFHHAGAQTRSNMPFFLRLQQDRLGSPAVPARATRVCRLSNIK
jgi:hypothetical protein